MARAPLYRMAVLKPNINPWVLLSNGLKIKPPLFCEVNIWSAGLGTLSILETNMNKFVVIWKHWCNQLFGMWLNWFYSVFSSGEKKTKQWGRRLVPSLHLTTYRMRPGFPKPDQVPEKPFRLHLCCLEVIKRSVCFRPNISEWPFHNAHR